MSNNTNGHQNGSISATQAAINNARNANPGIDANGKYIPGSAIKTDYDGYKDAQKDYAKANRNYNTTAKKEEAKRPYTAPTAAVGGMQFYQQGHQTLAPFASTAAGVAQTHAHLRDNFNSQFKPVLDAYGNYDGHVMQADQARNAARRHQNNAAGHIAAAQKLGGNNMANHSTVNHNTANQGGQGT